ncbi:hypothetical protein [Endozoicomonas sp. Mp262]|uniref:hypothetical protein n=1 Tax=Endozoicomonas sp. Mp262 TaxID=2919499 RepID=UPI0021DB19F4
MGRFREPIIIADSSPLIALALVELIPELVAMAQKVWIPALFENIKATRVLVSPCLD